jgi:hypothetical protein
MRGCLDNNNNNNNNDGDEFKYNSSISLDSYIRKKLEALDDLKKFNKLFMNFFLLEFL